MKLLLFSTLFFISSTGFTQNYNLSSFYSNGNQVGTTICDNPKNGIVIAGYYNDQGLLYSVDELGNILWKKELIFSQNDNYSIQFLDLKATIDSNFIGVGNYVNDVTQKKEGFLLKFSNNGDIIWQQFMRGGPSVEFNSAALSEMADSSYLVAWGSSNSGDGISLCKFDINGSEVWSKGYSFANHTVVSALKPVTDSTFVIAGDSYFGNGDNGLLAQVSDTGAIMWANSYIDIKIEDIIVDSNVFYFAGLRTTDSKRFVASSSHAGVINWMTSPSTDNDVQMGITSSLAKINDSCLVDYSSYTPGGSIASRIKTNGEVLATYKVDMFKSDMMPTANGGVLFIGNGPILGVKSLYVLNIGMIQRDSSFINGDCFWIAAMDSASLNIPNPNTLAPISSLAPTIYQSSITEDTVDLAFTDDCVDILGGLNETNIHNFVSVYPNLSDGQFHFKVSHLEAVDIQVYSPTGILLFEKETFSGKTTIDLSNYANGTYYYKVNTPGGLSNSGMLILQK